MIKKTITYIDYNDNERTEDFYFNLSKAELTEMELTETGGLVNLINKIIAEQDNKAIIKMFKDLVIKSHGVKSADGRKFIKNENTREDFTQTEAYSEIFMELATDADAAAVFVKGILPKEPQDHNRK